VGDQPTADAESGRRCIRVERQPSPRHGNLRTPSPLRVHTSINSFMRMLLPCSGKRTRIRDGLPQIVLLHGQAEAGVRRWPTTAQKGSSTPTSTAKEELVWSDDAHKIKGPFFAPCSVLVSVPHSRSTSCKVARLPSLCASSAPAISISTL
jgi:hypothetical protein